jgi:hypothetical protein
MTTTPNPVHDPSVDLWNCPCRECTRLEFEVTDTNLTLKAFRAEQFPAVWS